MIRRGVHADAEREEQEGQGQEGGELAHAHLIYGFSTLPGRRNESGDGLADAPAGPLDADARRVVASYADESGRKLDAGAGVTGHGERAQCAQQRW